jgi:FtsP/CotA-like multicopper oxidase with cupredoxin domain
MSLGVVAGFFIAYPINVWLVAKGMKHGLMTVRKGSDTSHAAHDPHAASHAGHSAAGPGESRPSVLATPTRTQLAALTGCTLLLLFAGMFVPAAFVNMRVTAEEVRGAIMPPGMIMTAGTSADAMRDMAAADPRLVTYIAPIAARGDGLLEPHIENGVKVYHLDASVIRWNILPNVPVTAYAINHQVPGPRLEFTEGDHVRIEFTNHLPDSATMHWHGLVVPNRMDGPGYITQIPVPPGGSYTYEYIVRQHGTYFYHSHTQPDRQQALGLYGALVIKPKDAADEIRADHELTVQLQEWLKRDGLTYPAMLMEGGLPNYFTINGKSYPATDTVHMRVGETVKFRFIGSNNNFIHPKHMHGGPFTVVARDGVTLAPPARFEADVINVGPGQRYDVIWPAREPGKWILHCHIPHHTLNNNVEEQGAGGLTVLVEVTGQGRVASRTNDGRRDRR